METYIVQIKFTKKGLVSFFPDVKNSLEGEVCFKLETPLDGLIKDTYQEEQGEPNDN